MLAELNTKVIEMVHPDTLKFAPFNPPARTESARVRKLKKEIEKAGEIIVPLVVTLDNYVADGHRRLTAARELNYEAVPVIRKELTLADLWSILNGANMPVGTKGWMQAVREGMPIECVPDKEQKPIADLLRVVGRKMFEKLTDEGSGPSVFIVSQYIARYCGRDNDKFIREVILWTRECKTMRDAKTAVSTGCPKDVLIAAIEERRGIRQFWGMS